MLQVTMYDLADRYDNTADYHIHISEGNLKMGKIPSFSLVPYATCSAASHCTCAVDGCYAMQSYSQYPNVRRAYNENTWLAIFDLPKLERELNELFDSMIAPRFFRVHVSGDFFSKEYAQMWIRVAEKHPHTNFLSFTKQFDIIRGLVFPENFILKLSDWPGLVIPEDLKAIYSVAWLDDGSRDESFFPADAVKCCGNCDHCGKCWNCKKDTIFKKHGAGIKRKKIA